MVTQRRKRAGTVGCYSPLTEDQIKLLDAIDFPWTNQKAGRPRGSDDKRWIVSYRELAQFYKKHGHFRVKYKSSLNNWVATQRQRRAGTGVWLPLTDEQIKLLDEIDFIWNPRKGRPEGLDDKRWIGKYLELAEFYKKHGHFRVKFTSSSLYNWAARQRQRRAGTGLTKPLTEEQIKLLDEIDFPWNPAKGPVGPNSSGWNAKYQELAQFYKKHGHFRLEYKSGLYNWMAAQRQRRAGTGLNKPLTDEQIKLLDEINFTWNSSSKLWHK